MLLYHHHVCVCVCLLTGGRCWRSLQSSLSSSRLSSKPITSGCNVITTMASYLHTDLAHSSQAWTRGQSNLTKNCIAAKHGRHSL